MPSRLLILSILVLCLPSPAAAQEAVVVAEQERLQKELQVLAGREAWDGVERIYHQLLVLEAQGAQVTYAEHMIGAQAAQQRGDVASTMERLDAALVQWDTELARNWLADINNNFGQITITMPQRSRTERTLQSQEMPFEPERRFAIGFAQRQLESEARFEGYLPVGVYEIGSRTFSVTAGQVARVSLEQDAESASGSGGARRTMPLVSARLRLGLGYAKMGPPSAGIQPASFGGPSPRAGLGMRLNLGERGGLGLEVGWMGVYSEPGQLSLGYGVLTGELVLPIGAGINVGAGPMFAVGSGQVTGLDVQALTAYCEGLPENSCVGLELTAAENGRVMGGIQAAGPAITASLPIFSAGGLTGSSGLVFSMLSDSSRWYPSAQIAVQISTGGGK